MPTEITISSLGGISPFDIYLCDNPITTCVYISTITPIDIPYTFDVPIIMTTMTDFNLKIVDNNDCVVTQNLILP